MAPSPSRAAWERLDQSAPSDSSGSWSILSTTLRAQTFTAGLSGELARIDLGVGRTEGTLTIEIRETSNGIPTDTVLASSVLSSALLAMDPVWFSAPANVTMGTQYAIVLSTDAAHSLGDSFDRELGPEPTEIAPNLWGQESEVFHSIDKYWGTIQDYVSSLLRWRGLAWVQPRLGVAHEIDRVDFVRHRVARDVEPAATAERVQPSLVGDALGIDAIEQVIRPDKIVGFERGTRHVRLAAEAKFLFIAHAAIGTSNLQHQ